MEVQCYVVEEDILVPVWVDAAPEQRLLKISVWKRLGYAVAIALNDSKQPKECWLFDNQFGGC